MFSKALFKQSMKANKTMWCIITFTVCFMLACVMLISGNGNIGEVKNSVEDTIITKELDSQMEKRAINYYENAYQGLIDFDKIFTEKASDTLAYLTWVNNKPSDNSLIDAWQESMPEIKTDTTNTYINQIKSWQESMPDVSNSEEYEAWQNNSPLNVNYVITLCYKDSVTKLNDLIVSKASNLGYDKDSNETNEMLGSVLYILNPNGNFNDFYLANKEESPEDYDILSLVNNINKIDSYLKSEERVLYIKNRASKLTPMFISGNMILEDNINNIVNELSSYGVTKEKYDSFGYTYEYIKELSNNAVLTYKVRLDYELEILDKNYNEGNYTLDEYTKLVESKKEELIKDISNSFLSTLPSSVSEAIEEIGQADLYTLIVGSIFYKLAGLLLPIIFMIMVSNNLIAGQVDRGSMAYILSTSTKRSSVVFTQAIYLITSLLSMFLLTTITGCVCLAIVGTDLGLTFGNLILLNLGAFLVLFALSGFCFFTSCYFDRSKRSMAIGGGLSIFALVAAMLGLFGSSAIPSVIRLDALNYFNFTTIISLFDVINIIDGNNIIILKLLILVLIGIVGYVLGSIKFVKKDLPL